jgi:O-antigen/teichoic acid export membrane protein
MAWTSVGSLLFRVISALTVFATARLTLNYLGAERYGLWMTITSAVLMMGFADLGLGDGVLAAISKDHGEGNLDAVRRTIASSAFVLASIAGILFLIFFLTYWRISWADFFNVKSPQARAEAGPATAVFLICFLAGLPLSLTASVYSGLQEGFVLRLWQITGSLMGLGAVGLCIFLRASLPWLVLSISAPPLAALFAGGAALFGHSKPHLRPNSTNLSWRATRELLRRSLIYLGSALLAPVAVFSDNLMIAHFVSAEAVSGYAVTAKLFGLCTLVPGIVRGSAWPAYVEAFARKDYAWIRRTQRRLIFWTTFLTGLPALFFFAAAPWILKLWLGQEVRPSPALTSGLALWVVLADLQNVAANLLWSVGLAKYDLIITAGMTALALALKASLTWKFGVPGVIWGLTISTAVAVVPSLWLAGKAFPGDLPPRPEIGAAGE